MFFLSDPATNGFDTNLFPFNLLRSMNGHLQFDPGENSIRMELETKLTSSPSPFCFESCVTQMQVLMQRSRDRSVLPMTILTKDEWMGALLPSCYGDGYKSTHKAHSYSHMPFASPHV
jgi:hypothetical protein